MAPLRVVRVAAAALVALQCECLSPVRGAVRRSGRRGAWPVAARRPAAEAGPAAEAEGEGADRRSVLGLLGPLVPLAFGVAANAPLFALVVAPPTKEAREGMLESWCKSDYCTLLGGGAGYVPQGGADGYANYVPPDDAAVARAEADLAAMIAAATTGGGA